MPTAASYTEKYNAERHAQYLKARLRRETDVENQRGEFPMRYMGISDWINATVDKRILLNAQMKLVVVGHVTVQALVRELRSRFAPFETCVFTAEREYRKVMHQEKREGSDTCIL
ncbi:hypothetical protein DL769_004197 [Monosporascus sp. CRB-8-3]|nr:hypothetical protein DL769_004197 [Monosporascus sp. CRB-8-3]